MFVSHAVCGTLFQQPQEANICVMKLFESKSQVWLSLHIHTAPREDKSLTRALMPPQPRLSDMAFVPESEARPQSQWRRSSKMLMHLQLPPKDARSQPLV